MSTEPRTTWSLKPGQRGEPKVVLIGVESWAGLAYAVVGVPDHDRMFTVRWKDFTTLYVEGDLPLPEPVEVFACWFPNETDPYYARYVRDGETTQRIVRGLWTPIEEIS